MRPAVGYPERKSGTDSAGLWDVGRAADAALVVAIGRWHEPALAEVYRRHGGAVHALAARVLGSAEQADDVTQEVFLRLWQRPEQFDAGRGSLRSFLLAITHSRAVDLLRSQRARRAREQREADLTAALSADGDATDPHFGDEVRRALSGLPERERAPIELAYFGGHTYREVAALLGEAEGTVKSRIRSGLGRLRLTLIGEGAE